MILNITGEKQYLDLVAPDSPDVLQTFPDKFVTVGTWDGPR